ncbi:MAG: hypothetical protein HYY01_09410 [Chloroflexi bacterium]|nr:hypothetical protein [Chloroflexota bacterium]
MEAAGIPTVFLSGCREVAEATRPPRTVFVRYPLGRVCGRPFNVEEQRAILGRTLEAARQMERSGEILELPIVWSEP